MNSKQTMTPQKVLSATRELPLHDAAATRRVEHHASSGLPIHALMRSAGSTVARWVMALYPHANRVWIAAGPGNNGGDGLDAAIHLHTAGKLVRVTHLTSTSGLPAAAQDALDRARCAGVTFVDTPPSLMSNDVALDALLGVGATRGPQGAIAQCVAQLNALICPTLAVDLPTGLCGDTGRVLGDIAVNAKQTLSLLTLKPGLFTSAGRDHAGYVWWSSLGVDVNEPASAKLIGPYCRKRFAAYHAIHKGRRGDTLVVGGAPGMTGAAWLAASAAHAAGSGRVFVSLLDPDATALPPNRPELMVRAAGWLERQPTLENFTVVAGCGGGSAIAAQLPRIISTAPRLVLDADGINAVAADSNLVRLLKARAARGLGTVLTPHPLEAARLMGCAVRDVQSDRLSAARQLAQEFAAVIVLKGSGTVVSSPLGVTWINPTGGPSLATAGTGDVLAGWLGGSWASSLESPAKTAASGIDAAIETALGAVYLHGLAADRAGVDPIRAADLVEAMLRTRSQMSQPSRLTDAPLQHV